LKFLFFIFENADPVSMVYRFAGKTNYCFDKKNGKTKYVAGMSENPLIRNYRPTST
jgi:hypothetical protein